MSEDVRQGQSPAMHDREAFRGRFMQGFVDPAFQAEGAALARIELLAWEAYESGRKAPYTAPAGEGFVDPDYALSLEWRQTRDRLLALQAAWGQASTPSSALVVCCSPRNDGTCPGEMSKTFRLAEMAREELQAAGAEVDVLDLSLLTSQYRRQIHPCKGCVSTAMPLCHWPCSCYPNHALGQVGDWMAEIYERWVRAHGILLVTPVHWYQVASPLKLMMDRLVCADGGNPDPTSTKGKDPARAKAIELAGWDYPKHLSGRAYGVVVHGDVAGIEGVRRSLSDWLDWMGLIDAGPQARLDRFIGYYEPYASSHQALDRDDDVQQEVRHAATALGQAIASLRAGTLKTTGQGLRAPRPK